MYFSREAGFRNNAVALLMFTICLWLGDVAVAQLDLLADGVGVTGCNPIGGRLLALSRYGDGESRNAEIVILEITDPEKRIRILHRLETLSPFGPLVTSHSRCGRFIVTTDEWTGAGTTKRDLVIYDLVRNEHSNYSIDDFLPKATVSQLESHGFIKGVAWNRIPAFDYDRMEYYPSVPRKCRELGFPFVVVDLLS